MAEKLYKCAICGDRFPEQHMVMIGKKRYCNDGCAQEKQRRDIDEGYRRDCIQYLMNLNQMETPNILWMKMLKEYHESGNYTYRGMLTTLITMAENFGVENKSETHYVYAIPHYYSEAKRYHIDQLERKKKMQEFEQKGKDFFNKRTVVVSGKDLEIKNENFAKVQKVDMNSIMLEGEEDE